MYGRSAGQLSPTPKEGQIGTTFSCWLECSFRTPNDANTAEEDASCDTAEVNGHAAALAAVAAAMKWQVNRNIGSWVVFNEDEKCVSSRDAGLRVSERDFASGLLNLRESANILLIFVVRFASLIFIRFAILHL